MRRKGKIIDFCFGAFVYAFSRRFYPKRLTNEDMKLQLTSKLTISYIEGKWLCVSTLFFRVLRGTEVKEAECTLDRFPVFYKAAV